MEKETGPEPEHWDSVGVRDLRRHMNASQQEMARRLGTRQQTISEWERGVYSPRGISSAILSVLAERSDFEYGSPKPRQRPTA
jgi:DNA-binding transcriptional regulator YiaG